VFLADIGREDLELIERYKRARHSMVFIEVLSASAKRLGEAKLQHEVVGNRLQRSEGGRIGFAARAPSLPGTGSQQSEGKVKDLCTCVDIPLQSLTAYQHKD
jgi:hypothetical protein